MAVAEYSPREVKKAVAGKGTASKEQVRFMVRSILSLDGSPMGLDASDAVAIAICHLHRLGNTSARHRDWSSFVAAHPRAGRAMIARLSGKLAVKSPTEIVIDVGGVAFALSVPLSTFERLPGAGETVSVFTHLHVREDLLQLYGFFAEEEREVFRILISVSGIGPKMAQGILSGLPVADLKAHIIAGNSHALTAIPGVGRKLAERLIVELRDKIAKTGGAFPSRRIGRTAGRFPRPRRGAAGADVARIQPAGGRKGDPRERYRSRPNRKTPWNHSSKPPSGTQPGDRRMTAG
jgi:Holliday junction DNA helicase RuvA